MKLTLKNQNLLSVEQVCRDANKCEFDAVVTRDGSLMLVVNNSLLDLSTKIFWGKGDSVYADHYCNIEIKEL